MLTFCYIVIIIVLRGVPRVYQISTEVKHDHNTATETTLDDR